MKLYLPEMNSVPTIAITFLEEVKTKIDTIHLFDTINLALMPFPDSPIVDFTQSARLSKGINLANDELYRIDTLCNGIAEMHRMQP